MSYILPGSRHFRDALTPAISGNPDQLVPIVLAINDIEKIGCSSP
jgi:hypothetical protein